MGTLLKATRRFAATVIEPPPEPGDDTTPEPEPEPTVTEERQRILRSVRHTYQVQLIPWKVFAATVIGGLIVDGDDVTLFAMLCLTPVLGLAGYLFTEYRLTRRHVGRGRADFNGLTDRRVRRVNRRAVRAAKCGTAVGVWLCLVSLTDPAGIPGRIVWALGALIWALVAYDGWWRNTTPTTFEETANTAVQRITNDDDDEHRRPAAGAPRQRVRRGGIPVPAAVPDHVDPPMTAPVAPLPDSSLLTAKATDVNPLPVQDDHTEAIQRVFAEAKPPMDVKVVGQPRRGPAVTRYTLQRGPGVSVKKIFGMVEDLRLECANKNLILLSPVNNQPLVGVEVPNTVRENVPLGKVLESVQAQRDSHPLLIAFGKDSDGQWLLKRLSDLVHLIIGGATGGGKSGAVNAVLVSLLTRAHPEDLRLLLIDLKRVELTRYSRIPHLITPVVTDATKAINALEWVIDEMEQRYKAMEAHGVRHIDDYNRKVVLGEITAPIGSKHDLRPYPYMVIVIDEWADLFMIAGEDVEKAVVRLTQKARAAGIHMVLATQRPSHDVVTGLIKANMPSRMALACASQVDSRVILDATGAEKLLGKGDALLLGQDASHPVRLQIGWVDDDQVDAVVEHWRNYSDAAAPLLPEVVLEAPRALASTPPMTTQEIVLDAARRNAGDDGMISREDLIQATPGIKEGTRNTALTKLFKTGEMENPRYGWYRVVPEDEIRPPEQEQPQ